MVEVGLPVTYPEHVQRDTQFPSSSLRTGLVFLNSVSTGYCRASYLMLFYDRPSQNSPKVKSDWVLTATLSRLEEQECS